MNAYDVPLGPDEVRQIADLLDKLTDFFLDDQAEYKAPFHPLAPNAEVEIGDVTIEIKRSTGGSVIGYAVLDDGWIGFKPATP